MAGRFANHNDGGSRFRRGRLIPEKSLMRFLSSSSLNFIRR